MEGRSKVLTIVDMLEGGQNVLIDPEEMLEGEESTPKKFKEQKELKDE